MSGQHDHLLGALWRKGDRVYRTVGIIYDPAVEIEDVETRERVTLVVGSLIYREYKILSPSPLPKPPDLTPGARDDVTPYLREFGEQP